MSEDRLQQECYLWFHKNFPNLRGLLFHPANGGSRSSREGAKFKAMGVVPGVSDLLFIYNQRLYAIELKTEKGTQSDKQKTWQYRVAREGVAYYIVRSVEEFKEIIKDLTND